MKELKQNASRVLGDVETHGDVLVTVAGRPVAVLTPVDARQRWVTTAELMSARARNGDPSWLDDLAAQRGESDLRDPFED